MTEQQQAAGTPADIDVYLATKWRGARGEVIRRRYVRAVADEPALAGLRVEVHLAQERYFHHITIRSDRATADASGLIDLLAHMLDEIAR